MAQIQAEDQRQGPSLAEMLRAVAGLLQQALEELVFLADEAMNAIGEHGAYDAEQEPSPG